jgi:hypothetical protein
VKNLNYLPADKYMLNLHSLATLSHDESKKIPATNKKVFDNFIYISNRNTVEMAALASNLSIL